MSKLEELLQQLCPDGVEYKRIYDCADYIQPSKYIVSDTNYVEKGTPVLTPGQSFILGYTTEENGIYEASKGKPIILFDDFTGSLQWVDFPFKVKSSACKIITTKKIVAIRYLYYVMANLNFTSDEHKRLWISTYSQLEIPVPPILVQEEIIRILDNFMNLTAELTAELTARKKQYEYYRDMLFSTTGADYKPITDIADTYIGLVTTMTKHYVEKGVKLIHNSDIKENHFAFSDMVYLDEEFAEKNKSRKHKLNDIITVHTGDVGTSAVIDESLDGSLGFATIVSRIKDDKLFSPRYICYFLNSAQNKKNIVSMIKGDRNNLNLKDFNRLELPIPNIDIQNKIVRILEKFDYLYSSVTSGLPAEIEARKKQYEYYRDKLLTFKRKEV